MEMLSSKKFIASIIAAVLSAVLVLSGVDIDGVLVVSGPLYAYIGAQGLADFGKERAKAAPTIVAVAPVDPAAGQ